MLSRRLGVLSRRLGVLSRRLGLCWYSARPGAPPPGLKYPGPARNFRVKVQVTSLAHVAGPQQRRPAGGPRAGGRFPPPNFRARLKWTLPVAEGESRSLTRAADIECHMNQ